MQYLQAQQQVEELKHQLDVIEFDNKQVSDQIQVEIQKMKVNVTLLLHAADSLPFFVRRSATSSAEDLNYYK